MKRVLLSIFLTIAITAFLPAAESAKNRNIDYLGVAAVLIKDGNYIRAEEALDNVDPEAPDTDTARYWTLKGLIALRKQDNEEAIEDFRAAVYAGFNDPVINAYLAQAYFSIGDYQQTVESIDKLPSLNQFPDLYGLKSQSYWFLGKKSEAFKTIDKGLSVFKNRSSFLQQKVFYLLELGLSQEALDISRTYLENSENDNAEGYITIAEAHRDCKMTDESIMIMEEALLKFPANARVKLMLAQCYVDREMYLTAAGIVEQLSYDDYEMTNDAAELYREAGDFLKSEYLNTLLSDQVDKTRLRFNTLIQKKSFEQAAALEMRLKRLGLLDEDGIKYALAYVFYQTQEYGKAVSYLSGIDDSILFRQSSQLRKAIESAKNSSIRYFNNE